MKRRTITLVIALSGLALAGIIMVQLFWIRHAMRTSQEKFDQIVSESMKAVVDKIERKESMVLITRTLQEGKDKFPDSPFIPARPHPGKMAGVICVPPPPPVPDEKTELSIEINSDNMLPDEKGAGKTSYSFSYTFDQGDQSTEQQHKIIIQEQQQMLNEIMTIRQHDLDVFLGDLPGVKIWKNHDSSVFALFNDNRFPMPGMMWEDEFEKRTHDSLIRAERKVMKMKARARKVDDVLQQVVVDMTNVDKPLHERIDSMMIKHELRKEFADRGIRLPFEFGVVTGTKDSLTALHSKGFHQDQKNKVYRAGLFPSELIPKTDYLLVNFPARQYHIVKSISLLMLASLGFTLFMIAAFGATLWIMIRQKKMAEIKNDFINNMTHEFKTPIATISLAIDSINNPKVIENPEMIRNYTRVIREENSRMNSHVEQVLQMALMDRKEIRLDKQPVDMHDLLDKAIENIRLQVENKNGYVIKLFDARHAMVEGDELHLFNVLMNLLDNANKYSPKFPEIKVYTYNTDGFLMISVEDKGIGMSTYTQKHVFERFYRAGTGNIHTVKGFGLGLSYAHAILDLHKSGISVKSESGKGSTFTISIPCLNDVENMESNT